jgi:uncharacterized protein (TIGR02246 family)
MDSTAADTAAIRRLVEQVNALQSDREPFIALHTSDVVVVNIAGRRVVGRETLDRAMADALGSELAHVVTRNAVEHVTFIRGDVALVGCTKHVEDHNPDAAERALPTRDPDLPRRGRRRRLAHRARPDDAASIGLTAGDALYGRRGSALTDDSDARGRPPRGGRGAVR